MAEATDPLGLVYTGRDNSGAANIITPRTRRSYADIFIDEIHKQAAKKTAIKDAMLKMVDPGNTKSWDRDMPYMQKLRDQYSTLAIDYEQKYGQNKDADIVKYNELLKKKEEMYSAAAASEAHRSIYEHYDKQLNEHADNYGEDARKNLEDFANKSFDQRVGTMPEITQNAADYMKSFKDLPAPQGSEKAWEAPDPANPGFTRTQKGTVYDREKDEPMLHAFMLKSPREASKAIQDTYAINESDPKFMAQYTGQPTAKDQTRFLYDKTIDRLAAMRASQIKTTNDQGLQPIPEHTAKSTMMGWGLDDAIKNGVVSKDVTFTANDSKGKPYSSTFNYFSSHKSTGVTVVTVNDKTLNLQGGDFFKDQRQFKFNPGGTAVMAVRQKDGSYKYEPYEVGQAVDTKNVPAGQELTVDESGNFKIGEKYVEKQNIIDVAIPLDKVKNFLQQKPNEFPTKFAYEGAERLNAAEQKPAQAESVEEVVRTTGDGKKAVFNSKTKKFIRWQK